MYAVFDGGAIILWYYNYVSQYMFTTMGAIYYSLYTIAIMLGIGLTIKNELL